MRKSLFTLILITLWICFSTVVKAEGVTINFNDFHNKTAEPYYDTVSSKLTQEIIKDFKKIKHIKLGDRKALGEKTTLFLVPESDIYSRKKMKEIAKASEGSDLVLLGSLKLDKKKNLKIHVKYLDVKKVKIINSFNISGPEAHLHKISDRIVYRTIKVLNTKMPDSGAVELTPKLKKAIEKGSDTTYPAYITLEEVEENLAKEDYKRAILQLEKVLILDPKYYKAYEMLGKINEDLNYNSIAFFYYNLFLSKSLKTLGKEKLMNIYYKMAQHLDNAGAFGASLDYFKASLVYEKTFDDPKSLGDKYFFVGIEKYKNADSEGAIKSLKKAMEIYQRMNSNINLARVYEALGYIHLKKNELQLAKNDYEKAIQIYEQFEDKLRSARVYNMLGLIYSEDKKLSEALTFFGMSLDYWVNVGHHNGVIQVYLNIAQVYEKSDQSQNALYFYEKGLEESRLIGDPVKIALFSYYLVTLKSEQNPTDLTINEEGDIKNIEKVSKQQRLAGLFNNIGLYYQSYENYNKAFEYFVKAVNINESLGHKVNLDAGYNNLGLYFIERKDFSNAFLYLVKALKVSEELGDQLSIAKRYHNIGALYYKKQEYDKGLLSFKRSLSLREENGDPLGIANTSYDMALLYYASGNKEKAVELVQRAIKIEKQYGSPNYHSSRRLLNKINKMESGAIGADSTGRMEADPNN